MLCSFSIFRLEVAAVVPDGEPEDSGMPGIMPRPGPASRSWRVTPSSIVLNRLLPRPKNLLRCVLLLASELTRPSLLSRLVVRPSDLPSSAASPPRFLVGPGLGDVCVMLGSRGLGLSYTSLISAPDEMADIPREKSILLPICEIDSPRRLPPTNRVVEGAWACGGAGLPGCSADARSSRARGTVCGPVPSFWVGCDRYGGIGAA